PGRPPPGGWRSAVRAPAAGRHLGRDRNVRRRRRGCARGLPRTRSWDPRRTGGGGHAGGGGRGRGEPRRLTRRRAVARGAGGERKGEDGDARAPATGIVKLTLR